MDKFFEAIKTFIARDVIYIVGGGAVMATFIYIFHGIPNIPNDWIMFLLLGVAYFVGYALSDGLGLIGVIPNRPGGDPNKFVRWLYRRFTGSAWAPIDQTINLIKAAERIAAEPYRTRLERISNLRHVGATGGSSFFVCSLMLFYYWFDRCEFFALAAAIFFLAFGAILIFLSWVKSAQQAQYIATTNGV